MITKQSGQAGTFEICLHEEFNRILNIYKMGNGELPATIKKCEALLRLLVESWMSIF